MREKNITTRITPITFTYSCPSRKYPCGRLEYIRKSETMQSAIVSVSFLECIRKRFKSVSVISRL